MIEQDVLNRIEFFLNFKHWSIYKLAKESGLSYSSLNNIFNRKTCPSIVTLEKICHGFGITLSEFFEYDNNPLRSEEISEREQDILNSFRTLSISDKNLLEAYLNGLCKK